ncbi:MAG: GNAT family N-acetyltransferase [Agriterribacter sp.]
MTTIQPDWQPDYLENDLVRLIPLYKDDFEKLYAVASDPLIWEQHPAKDRYEREVFQLFFDGAVAGNTAFLIIDKASGNIIGSTRYYDYKPENSSIAIGYTFLAKAYWGGRYNQSCKKLLLDYAFQFVDKIYFHVGATNTRSQLAIQKTGGVKVNEADFDHYGKKLLHFEYIIKKEDWK